MENRFWKIQANLLAFVAGVGAMGIQMHVAERHRLWPLIGAGSVREKVLLLMGASEETRLQKATIPGRRNGRHGGPVRPPVMLRWR